MRKIEFVPHELKNIILFSTGKLISVFGSLIFSFAMSLYILRQTGDGLSFATNMIISIIPIIIISPFAGVLADHFNRKLLVVIMDLLSGLLLISLFIYIEIYSLSILIIYLTTFILSMFGIIYGISLESAKPHIVSDEKLMNINSFSQIIDSTSSILAPILGGVIYAFVEKGQVSMGIFIVINGVSFILSAILGIFINFKLNKEEETSMKEGRDEKIHVMKNIKEGFVYLKSNKRLKSLISYFIILNFCLGFGLSVPLPYIINQVLKLGATYFGIVEGALSVGLIIGALFIKKIYEKITYETLLTRTVLANAFILGMLGLPLIFKNIFIFNYYYLIYFSFMMVGLGVTIAFIDIPLLYLLQKLVEEKYRGRVMSLSMGMFKLVSPIALLISGLLINQIKPWLLPLIGGVIAFLATIYRILKKKIV